MPKFTEEQKRIAVLLLNKPKTIEQLNKQLDIPFDALTNQIKEMVKLKVVTKEDGFPTKYNLKPDIVDAVKKRKEISEIDEHKLRLKIIIEAQAIEQTLLEKSLKEIEEKIRNEKIFTIYDCVLEKMIKEGEHYSSFLEVNLSVKDFSALMHLLFFYGPTSIEVIKPSKMEFTADDLQDGLVDASSMIQAYNKYIIEMMDKKELADFTKKLFEKSK